MVPLSSLHSAVVGSLCAPKSCSSLVFSHNFSLLFANQLHRLYDITHKGIQIVNHPGLLFLIYWLIRICKKNCNYWGTKSWQARHCSVVLKIKNKKMINKYIFFFIQKIKCCFCKIIYYMYTQLKKNRDKNYACNSPLLNHDFCNLSICISTYFFQIK